MIGLLSFRKNQRKISVKHLLFTFFVCISMVTWLGISDLRADEVAPGEYTDETEVAESNDAQSQRLRNVANAAASQDDTEGFTYEDKFTEYEKEILDLRAQDMGWGDIVHYLNDEYGFEIPTSVLGLGHAKKSSENVEASKHSNMQSGNNQGQGLALGHTKDNSNNRGGGNKGGNGDGNGGGNGGGKK